MTLNTININWHTLFSELNFISITTRLLMAVVMGFIVGADRGIKGKVAGIKTHILVCMGSSLTMIVSQYMADYTAYDVDITRLSAQVISGIGFLGAGTIIVTGHNKIVGLSTAAGLWVTACIGLVIGIGYYEAVIISGIIVLFVFLFIPKVEDRIYKHRNKFTIHAEFENDKGLKEFLDVIHFHNCSIKDINIEKSKLSPKKGLSVIIDLEMQSPQKIDEILAKASEISTITFLERT